MTLTEMSMERRAVKMVRLSQLGNCPVVSGPDLAAFLDITEQRVRQLTRSGMPKVARGAYPLLGCVWWYIYYCKRNARARKRSKIKVYIKRKDYEKLCIKIELLRIKLKMTSGELVESKLREGRDLLIHNLDCQLRRLPKKMEHQFGWREEETRSFEAHLNDARDDFICETDPIQRDADNAQSIGRRSRRT